MSLRSSVFPAALALAGCLPSESEPPPELEQVTYSTPETGGGVCDLERVSYLVRGELLRDEPREKSARSASTLLVAVSESSTVVDCAPDLVRVATPGAELTHQAFPGDAEGFALEVASMLVGGHRPSIRVTALLDENDNGTCDPGELSGSAQAADVDELGALAIALSSDCFEQQ